MLRTYDSTILTWPPILLNIMFLANLYYIIYYHKSIKQSMASILQIVIVKSLKLKILFLSFIYYVCNV